jgi:RHS repeat-associated protein
MQLQGRTFSSENYRYGFNGKEKDPETYGEGNIYDYGFRVYNPRLGKFLSVDPLCASYPFYTPYQFAGNKPIAAIDLDGLEEYVVINFRRNDNSIYRTEIYTVTDEDNERADQEVKQLVHNVRSGEGVAKGNVLVFDVFNLNQRDQLMQIDQSRNKADSRLTSEELDILAQANNEHLEDHTSGLVSNSYPRTSEEGGTPAYESKPFDITKNKRFAATRTYQTRARTITPEHINFVPGGPDLATPHDKDIINGIAALAPNQIVQGPVIRLSDGSTTQRITTRRSIVTVNLSTDMSQNSGNVAMINGRFNAIRKQLNAQGIPRANIRLGAVRYDVPHSEMEGQVNKTTFTISTTVSSSTNIRRR